MHCLPGDDQSPDILYAAPWLIGFQPASGFGDWAAARMAASPCGLVIVVPTASLPDLLAALRLWLPMTDTTGAPLIVRWWDIRTRNRLGNDPPLNELDALQPQPLHAEPPAPLFFRPQPAVT